MSFRREQSVALCDHIGYNLGGVRKRIPSLRLWSLLRSERAKKTLVVCLHALTDRPVREENRLLALASSDSASLTRKGAGVRGFVLPSES